MCRARLPVVDWTDAPADLNGLVRFPERRNLVSARVSSHFKCSLPSLADYSPMRNLISNTPTFLNLVIVHLPAYEDGTGCSETLAYKIQTPGNYTEESIQHEKLVYIFHLTLIDWRTYEHGIWGGANLYFAIFVIFRAGNRKHYVSNSTKANSLVLWTK